MTQFADVRLHFRVPRDKAKNIYKAREWLTKAGITFDSGHECNTGDIAVIDWEFDWSLSNGCDVIFKTQRTNHMDNMEKIISDSPQFYLVYQSGHCDTWCNGKVHIQFNGDRNGVAPINNSSRIAEITTGKCDCENWKH